MATVRPRVQVCLDFETKAVYDNLASVFGVSTSRMIATVLADCAPGMVKVAEAMQQAKRSADPASFLEAAKGFAVDSRQVIADEQVHLEDLIAESKNGSKARPKA